MKKILIAVFLFFTSVVIADTGAYASESCTCGEKAFCSSQITSEYDKDLYENLLITLIYPHVEKAIEGYYDEYMSYLPREDPWSYKILSIEKMSRQNYSYRVKVEVRPYVGPHLSVGHDHVTLSINTEGVRVEEFRHLESHELPPHYQDIIIKALPGV